jgi:hypothetical protein
MCYKRLLIYRYQEENIKLDPKIREPCEADLKRFCQKELDNPGSSAVCVH